MLPTVTPWATQRFKFVLPVAMKKTVELSKSYGLVISPAIPILHIQAESWGHLRCLNLLEDAYLKAAARAGFKLLSMCETPIVGVAVQCESEA